MPMAGFYVLNISPSRSQTHPNLPQKATHPNLPKGKEQVTLQLNISPLSVSPEGEMLVTTLLTRAS